MEYTLLDKIMITRPILFLCGPYYERNNKSDRRVILQEKIYSAYKNKYLPLVIDDFLTDNNINDNNISIQLMEEICAAVSYKTYIFLDTMSSATELGIFAKYNLDFFGRHCRNNFGIKWVALEIARVVKGSPEISHCFV